MEIIKNWFRSRDVKTAPNLRDFLPLDPVMVSNPYPTYQYLRTHDPIHRSSLGVWVLTRKKDIQNALKDARFVNTPSPYSVIAPRNQDKYVCASAALYMLPFLEGQPHKNSRKIIAKHFQTHLKKQESGFGEIANQQVDKMLTNPNACLLADFATPFAIRVICDLIGFPVADSSKLKNWCESFFFLLTGIPTEEKRIELDRALTGFRQYVSEQLDNPKSDSFFSALSMEGGLERQAIIDNTMLIFADAVENVDRGIVNMLYLLLQNPDQLNQIYKNPDLVSCAVKESLRFEPPAQFVARVAAEDIVLDGKTIKKHSAVYLVLASSNRDEDQCENPESFEIKASSSHLSFGAGRHSCLGGKMAELEMEVALKALLTPLQDRQINILEEISWESRVGHRWPKNLRVQIH